MTGSMIGCSMNDGSSYGRNHRILFEAFCGSRKLPTADARTLVRQRLNDVRGEYAKSRCASTLIAYQRYLAYFSRRFGSPELVSELTLIDAEACREHMNRDPSRPDDTIGLALACKAQGKPEMARALLRRIAASGLREAESARRLLADMVDEALR